VKKNILDNKPTANKKCDSINVPRKTADTATVVSSTGVEGFMELRRAMSSGKAWSRALLTTWEFLISDSACCVKVRARGLRAYCHTWLS
jgi:hypothetical protein